MHVFVTGSSAHLAAALLPRLCADPEISRVTGIDRLPPRFAHPKFSAHRLDVRDPAVAKLLGGCDALVHLAFVVLRGKMPEREMFDINVTGSHRVFHAARSAGVRRLVHLSSAAVYGEGVHLTEDAPLTPLAEFLYGQHKAYLERLLEIEFPECVRLRPHVVLGPNAQPLLKWLLRQPFYPRLEGRPPLLQCVHEEDVASAIMLALKSAVGGAFNLAVDDNFSFRDAIASRHRLRIPLPLGVARRALSVSCDWFGWGGEVAWIEGLSKTLLLNCRRAHVELGWHSERSAAQVLAAV